MSRHKIIIIHIIMYNNLEFKYKRLNCCRNMAPPKKMRRKDKEEENIISEEKSLVLNGIDYTNFGTELK